MPFFKESTYIDISIHAPHEGGRRARCNYKEVWK